VGVADKDLNVDDEVKDTIEVMVTSDHGETEMLVLTESDVDTSRFIGTLNAYSSNNGITNNDGKLNLNKRTQLKATYVDYQYGEQTEPETIESTVDFDVDGPSGGGSFDYILMMLLGALGVKGLTSRRKLKALNTK